jgi:hypothetical protein
MTDDEPYGYDPAKRRAAVARDLFGRMEQEAQAKSKGFRKFGEVIRKISRVKHRLMAASAEIKQIFNEDITYQHSIFCQTVLPIRRPPDDVRVWEKLDG